MCVFPRSLSLVGFVALGGSSLIVAQQTAPPTVVVSNVKEFDRAWNIATPGTTITLRDGEWKNVRLNLEGAYTINTRGGSETAPIVVRSQTLGGARFTGKSRLSIAGEWIVVDGLSFVGAVGKQGEELITFRNDKGRVANNSRLINVAMASCNPAKPEVAYDWVGVYGSDNRVEQCSFQGMNHKGVTVAVNLPAQEKSNYHVIARNYFGPRARGAGTDPNGFETLRIGDSSTSMNNSRTTVEGNVFDRCNGEVEVVSSRSCENIFRGNTFVDCEGSLSLRMGHRSVVDANWFLGTRNDSAGGVAVFGDDHVVTNNHFAGLNGIDLAGAIVLMNGQRNPEAGSSWPARNTFVAHNTIAGCRAPLVVGAYYDVPEKPMVLKPQGVVVANNILVVAGSQSPVVTPFKGQVIAATYQANIAWGGEVGLKDEAGLRVVDPMLIASAEGEPARPATDSPARGAAAPLAKAVATDIDGQPRPALAADIGADQASTTPPTRQRPTRATVGPRWATTTVASGS